MSFNITSFANLCSRFNTWSDLHTYLTSNDGGSLRVVNVPDSEYAIVRYVKGKSDMAQEHVRMFRSVVWNTQTNRPVCVAPVKAERGEPPVGSDVSISEFVDGVMINLFRDNNGQLRLSTRTNLGASNTFYTSKSFADMLNEACNNDLENAFGSLVTGNTFVNLVLQHPDHKTVGPVKSARYFITSTGTVSEDGSITFYTHSCNAHAYPSGKSVRELMNFGMRRGHMWQGLVFQDKTSHKRWRIRNPDFVRVRTLRGSESDAFERFLRLRATGKTKEYISFFRSESNELWAYEQLWRQRTQDLYNSYVDMNKLKKKTMKDLDFPLRTHVYTLHGRYLASLPKPQADSAQKGEVAKHPVPVTMDTVIDYVNSLSVEEQTKIVNGAHKKAEWRTANNLV
jgi:hypothetical protein